MRILLDCSTASRLSARFVPANGYTFTDVFDIERK